MPRRTARPVSYDTNLRLRLWPLDRARAVIHAALALADIARPSIDDARQLTGLDRPEDIADSLRLGCRIVALTMGGDGTLSRPRTAVRSFRRKTVEVVDATGAGDTFDRRLPRRIAAAWRPLPRRGLRQRRRGAATPATAPSRRCLAARRSRPLRALKA